jgi:hypothetical protein
MGASQLGTLLTDDEVDQITAFLDSLTGDQPNVTYPIPAPERCQHTAASAPDWDRFAFAESSCSKRQSAESPQRHLWFH